MTSYVNIFEDMDFMMRLLSGEFDDKIKKGKMKISYAYGESNKDRAPKSVDEPVEVSIEEVVESEPVAVNEPVQVDSIEEVMGIELVIDEESDEGAEVFAPKCTDIEKAISVLDGSCTDMDSEDFEPEVWAEANELYYSMEGVSDYIEEEELGVGTVISMSNKRLSDFFTERIESIESWNEDESTNEGAEIDYVYEDDEVNVVEECDVTIFSFAKAFSCMMPRVA